MNKELVECDCYTEYDMCQACRQEEFEKHIEQCMLQEEEKDNEN